MEITNFISPKKILEIKKDIVEEALVRANPIIAGEYDNGIILMAENPNASLAKISEIYDRIAFAGTGVYNDYEKLRKAGVQHADLRGFTYSRKDVSAKSIAGEYATILGDIFGQQQVPLEVEILVVELGASQESNRMYYITYSGGLVEEHGFAVIGDIHLNEEDHKPVKNTLEQFLSDYPDPHTLPLKEVFQAAYNALDTVKGRELPAENLEVAILDRTVQKERKFKKLSRQEINRLSS